MHTDVNNSIKKLLKYYVRIYLQTNSIQIQGPRYPLTQSPMAISFLNLLGSFLNGKFHGKLYIQNLLKFGE